MLALIQRVVHANVKVNNAMIGEIQHGILAFIGIEKTDTKKHADEILQKIIKYRVFADPQGKTNLSLQDIKGGLLLVPQFTLVAETDKGLRPGFSKAMAPDESKALFQYLVGYAKANYTQVETGEFGADMQVTLTNDGPMTFMLRI